MAFRADRAFIAELMKDAEYKAFMENATEELKAEVEQIAEGFRKTGEFSRSITSSKNMVGSTHPFWSLIERGSVNNPAYAPFRRAVRATGLRLREQDE